MPLFPDCDDVLVAGDVITARQLHHQHLVQRGHGLEVEAVETFDGRELCSLDPPFHHAAFPVDEFQFGKPQKVTGMINAFCRALFGDFVILAQESRQTQGLQMMGQQQLRRTSHPRPPDNSAM